MKRWLVALGVVFGGVWLWRKAAGAKQDFTVRLENVPYGSTTWNAFWWDGVKLTLSDLGPNRPVNEAARFSNVSAVAGSFVLAEVLIGGVPVQQAAMLSDPVNGASYAFDWLTRTLRLL